MSISHTTAVRTVLADGVCNAATGQLGANGKLIIYSGAPPANAQAALSGNTAISTITALNFGAAASGVSTVTSSTADSNAVGGVATFFRITKTDGTTVIFQGTVTATGGGGDLTLPSTTITAGITVTLSSGTYTASA